MAGVVFQDEGGAFEGSGKLIDPTLKALEFVKKDLKVLDRFGGEVFGVLLFEITLGLKQGTPAIRSSGGMGREMGSSGQVRVEDLQR